MVPKLLKQQEAVYSVWWLAKNKLQNCERIHFLLYINDLQFASDLLDAIMFADDTNLFYSNKDINTAFLKVNDELQKINEWFISNKLSLNVKKTKYSFFHKPSKKRWYPTNLRKINSQQKHALRIIFNKSKFEHTSELFKSSKILNVYKINIFNTAVFMHKIQGNFFRNLGNPLIRIQRHSHI